MAAQNPTIFGVGLLGRSPAVSAQQRVNCYVEIDPQGDRSRYTLYGLPGLTTFTTIGDTPIRGLTSLGSYMYAVHRDTLYQIRNDGVITSKGTLSTTEGRVVFANNSDYLLLVDGTEGYTYRESTDTFALISDVDFPDNPVTCTFLQGYFIVSAQGSEQFDISTLDNPTSWPGDFDLAYADPDALIRAFSLQGLLVLLGGNSMEYWGYTGAADFPFARVTASQYGWGMEARYSVVMVNSRGFALLRRREGGLAVCQFGGGEPQPVSPPDLNALFDAYAQSGVVTSAVGSGFSIAGHPFYQIHFPDIGATWLYDVSTGIWCQRKSYGLEHYRGVEGIQHLGSTYWTDYDTGSIWKQSEPTVRSDNTMNWNDVVWTENSGVLATAWDVSTAIYASKSVDVSTEDAIPRGLAFSADGTKMYVGGGVNAKVFQYTLADAWDVSTASYASKSVDVSTEDAAPTGLAFSADGTKMYVGGSVNAKVFQYTLADAWDVSTASYASKSVDVSTEDAIPRGLAFSADGTKMYVGGGVNDKVFQYTLSAAWDVSTAIYASKSVDVSTEDATPRGLAFSADGTKMYVGGSVNDKVFQYTLATAWDVSTAIYASKSVDVSTESTSIRELAFSDDGTKMYVVDVTADKVFQYTLGEELQNYPVEFEVTGEHIHSQGNRGITIKSLEIGMETGLGTQTGQGVAPKIMLQLSGDRGHSFGTELLGDIGAAGKYSTRVRWHRLGQWRDVMVRLRITDPVPRVITDEALEIVQAYH